MNTRNHVISPKESRNVMVSLACVQTLLAGEDGRKREKVPLSVRPPPQVKSARRLGFFRSYGYQKAGEGGGGAGGGDSYHICWHGHFWGYLFTSRKYILGYHFC